MRSTYRRDINGLRALAVGLVLLYHARVPGFGGGFVGVDVFFVVSGFLITGLLVRELDERGRIDLLRFYSRRARRLLPASFTVLGFVGLTVIVASRWLPELVLPQLYGQSIAFDIQRSALYIVNWLFAERSVSYQGSEDFGSPVLHFWSLSVEEQFYFVWPILILSVAAVSSRSKSALAAVIALVTVASLVHSWRFTISSPDDAYFVTTTRVWEMSLGALAALVIPKAVTRLQMPQGKIVNLAGVLGLPICLAAILFGAMRFSETTPYPGTAALVPTVATVGILFVGSMSQAGLVRPLGGRLLERRPLQWIGDRSYSIYLWHWPALWIATAVLGALSWQLSLLVVVASLAPAMASYRFIEQPLRHSPRFNFRPLIVLGGAATTTVAGYLIGSIVLAGVGTSADFDRQSVPAITTEVAGVQLIADSVLPPVSALRDDVPDGYRNGCFLLTTDTPYHECHVGDREAGRTIIAVGSSHIARWSPALDEIAIRNDLRIVYIQRNGCTIYSTDSSPEVCSAWVDGLNARLGELIHEVDASAILVAQQPVHNRAMAAQAQEQFGQAFTMMRSHGIPVALIAPVPIGLRVGVDCPSSLVADLTACALDRSIALAGSEPILNAAAASDVRVLDMTPYLCSDSLCPAIIDNMYVRTDDDHLTTVYAKALTDKLQDELFAALPELTQ